jgi:hypothetical protein
MRAFMATNRLGRQGRSSMSEHAIEFLRGWIGEKVQCQHSPMKIEKQAETLARECAAKAAEEGILLEDIQEEVGDIQELIASRLEEAAEGNDDATAPDKPSE